MIVRLLDRPRPLRPELRAWAMYDWANSAFWSTVVTAVFPPILQRLRGRRPVAGRGDGAVRLGHHHRGGHHRACSGRCSAPSPTIARWKKRLLAVFMGIGVIATLLMATIDAR